MLISSFPKRNELNVRKQSAYGWEWKLSTLEAERLTKRAESAGAASISSCSCATQFLATCRAITGTSIQRSEKSVKRKTLPTAVAHIQRRN